MKKIICSLLGLFAGKLGMQGFYEGLLGVALDGMNYGRGGNFRTSGELHLLHHIKNTLKDAPKPILFDVGANIGEYSIALADFFGPTSTVHAFEPSKETFDKLKTTIGSRTNLVANNCGFSDIEGTLRLYKNTERHTRA